MAKYNVSKQEAKRLGIKRIKTSSSKSSSSNNRGGLSAREYAAKQSGGTLNYQTGAVTRPTVTKSTSSDPYSKYTSNKSWDNAASQYRKDNNLGNNHDLSGTTFDLKMKQANGVRLTSSEQAILNNSNYMQQTQGVESMDKDYNKNTARPNINNYSSKSSNKTSKNKTNNSSYVDMAREGNKALYKLSETQLDERGVKTEPTFLGNIARFLNRGTGEDLSKDGNQNGFALTGNQDLGWTEKLGINKWLFSIPTAQAFEESDLGIEGDSNPFSEPEKGETDLALDDKNITRNTEAMMTGVPNYAPTPVSPSSITGGGSTTNSTNSNNNDNMSAKDLGYDKDSYEDQQKDLEERDAARISGLDPKYARYRETAASDFDKSKSADVNKLFALMAAYGTADSKQRLRKEQRVRSDYGSKQAELFRDYDLAKQQEISGIQDSSFNAMNALRDKQNAAKQQVAQLMMNMQEAQKARDFTAQQNSLSRSSSAGQASQNQRTAQIQALLGRGAQMNSGGREFVNAQSSQMGLGDLSGYMPNGWEPAYNPGWNQPEWQKQGIGEQFIDMNNPSSWNRASVSGGNGLDNMSAAELLRMYNGG